MPHSINKAHNVTVVWALEVSQALNTSHSPMSLSLNSDPVSAELMQLFHFTFLVIICGLVSLFGIVTNIVNIIIFVRQKFKERINVSLFSLALADLCCVLTMLWTSISGSPLVAISVLPFNEIDVSYSTGALPHIYFNRVTTCITAFITLERCLCIIIPLKVKNMFTVLTTKVINASIFFAMLLMFTPFYFVNSLAWIYNQKSNKTLLTLVQTEDSGHVESATFLVHSVALSVTALISVVVCTIILVHSLNKKTKWRQTTVVQVTAHQEKASTKDKKVVKMIVLISTIFIVCYTPATVTFVAMKIFPEFSFSGSYRHLFILLWCLTLALETVNSSVNIFIYFNMSTKFRTIYIQLLYQNCCQIVNVQTVDKKSAALEAGKVVEKTKVKYLKKRVNKFK